MKSGFSPARTDISLYYQSRTDNNANRPMGPM